MRIVADTPIGDVLRRHAVARTVFDNLGVEVAGAASATTLRELCRRHRLDVCQVLIRLRSAIASGVDEEDEEEDDDVDEPSGFLSARSWAI